MEISKEEALVILECAFVAYSEGLGPEEGYYELLSRIFEEYPEVVKAENDSTSLLDFDIRTLKKEVERQGKP